MVNPLASWWNFPSLREKHHLKIHQNPFLKKLLCCWWRFIQLQRKVQVFSDWAAGQSLLSACLSSLVAASDRSVQSANAQTATFFGPSWGHGWFYDVLPSGYLTVCHGKWPIYRWFTWVYLLKMVIIHGYVSHNQMVYVPQIWRKHVHRCNGGWWYARCRSAQLKFLGFSDSRLPPYLVVNHHCPYETCNLEGKNPIVRQTLTVTHIAMRLQHATCFLSGSRRLRDLAWSRLNMLIPHKELAPEGYITI